MHISKRVEVMKKYLKQNLKSKVEIENKIVHIIKGVLEIKETTVKFLDTCNASLELAYI